MGRVSVLYGMGKGNEIHPEAIKYIEEQTGISWDTMVWDGKVEVPELKDDASLKEILAKVLDDDQFTFDHEERLKHSIGKSSPEILDLMNGKYPEVVDAVAYPDYGNAGKLLAMLRENNVFATVFGGGTSVTGSFDFHHKGLTVAIDARNFRHLQVFDNYATIGSGFRGMELEEALAKKGFTMGNFPESIEHSTVGGWLATKATGQESNQYGDIENMIISASISRSDGEFSDLITPRESAGLMIKDLSVGSEGNYGLITDITAKVHPIPGKRHFESYFFPSFQDGIKALRGLRTIPTVTRLSDGLETYFAMINSSDSFAKRLLLKYMSMRGINGGSLLVVMNNEGPVAGKFQGGVSAGPTPARLWYRDRYERPYMANELWERGLVPDTLETSATWEDIEKLYENAISAFNDAKDERGFRGNIMAHISHIYRTGACIYFTFIIKPEKEDDLSVLRDRMVESFLGSGGSISHHHGLGNYLDKFLESPKKELMKSLRDPVFSRW